MILSKPLVRLTTAHYQSTVSMISFAQVWAAQWSDMIPSQNVQFTIGIHLTLFRFNSIKVWSCGHHSLTYLRCKSQYSLCLYITDLLKIRASSLWHQYFSNALKTLKQKDLQLLWDVDTRWSLTLLMVECALILCKVSNTTFDVLYHHLILSTVGYWYISWGQWEKFSRARKIQA